MQGSSPAPPSNGEDVAPEYCKAILRPYLRSIRCRIREKTDDPGTAHLQGRERHGGAGFVQKDQSMGINEGPPGVAGCRVLLVGD